MQNDRPERERVEGVLLPPAAGLSDEYLEGWCDGQVYLLHNQRAALRPADGLVEPVAVIGKDWSLLWASPDSLADIVKRTGIAIGTPLYAATALRSQEARNAE